MGPGIEILGIVLKDNLRAKLGLTKRLPPKVAVQYDSGISEYV